MGQSITETCKVQVFSKIIFGISITMYIELDHELVPGKISDIYVTQILPTGKEEQEKSEREWGDSRRPVKKPKEPKKYKIQHGDINQAIVSQNAQRIKEKKEENQKDFSEYEAVAGTDSGNFYYDHDWGFFSAILACYNNHWVLRTSPDDWWNVIVRNVAQTIDEIGERKEVRNFFVEHQGKKTIDVVLPENMSLAETDYNWLFEQFSKGIRQNIKAPEYVDVMQADFTTTTHDQLIASQIMLMSSLQKYFDFQMSTTRCGIPGVEMNGTLEDWKKLVKKTEDLQLMLKPILGEDYFESELNVLKKLVDTYEGNPDKKWWSHILSWNVEYGSGARPSYWSGWMIDFLKAGGAKNPRDFQSGMVSVPLTILDRISSTKDVGHLVAGTFGYTVEEGERAPVVEAKQGWSLFLPKGSPIIPLMKRQGHRKLPKSGGAKPDFCSVEIDFL